MKKIIQLSILCAALHGAIGSSTSAAEESSRSTPTREETVLTTVTASVEDINLATREITLKGPLGNVVTFTFDQRGKRLNEVKVGDLVRANYHVSVAAEIREPTAEEKDQPAVGKAPPGTLPAAGGLRRFKVVTTIEGLDRPTRTVTVKGPMGRYLTARVADPARLTQVRIGDTIVLT